MMTDRDEFLAYMRGAKGFKEEYFTLGEDGFHNVGAEAAFQGWMGHIEYLNRKRASAAPVPQIAEVQDGLVAISAAIADQDDSAAQSRLRDRLSMLAAAPQPPQEPK